MPVQQLGTYTRVTKSGRRHKLPIRAENLLAALQSEEEMDRQAPEAPKPAQMIEKVRIVGDDDLTASDQAVYALMLAWARKEGLDRDEYEIPFDAVKTYTGMVRTDDLVLGLHRLSTTMVKYDIRDEEFRRRGTVPFVLSEVRESLKDGTALLAFSIPSHVRRLMSSAQSYTWVELGAFAKFRCRYTARLYQRLALLAGYDDALRKPWEIAPKDLAELLGWKYSGKFRYIDFRQFCLDPVRCDIEAHVMRFSLLTKEVPAETKGRGRRAVGLIRFTVTPEMKKLETLVAAPLNSVEMAEITKPDPSLSADKLPSIGAVGRVVRLLEGRRAAVFLSEAWRAAVDEAIKGTLRTDVPSPGEHDLHGRDLLDLIESLGANHSFYVWSQRADHTGRFLTRLMPVTDGVYVPPIRDLPAEERPRAYAVKSAQELLDHLAGRVRAFSSTTFPMWCEAWHYPEVGPWSWLIETRHPDGAGALKAALRLIPRLPADDAKRTFYNLAHAVLDDDMSKVDTICRAVCAAARVEAE